MVTEKTLRLVIQAVGHYCKISLIPPNIYGYVETYFFTKVWKTTTFEYFYIIISYYHENDTTIASEILAHWSRVKNIVAFHILSVRFTINKYNIVKTYLEVSFQVLSQGDEKFQLHRMGYAVIVFISFFSLKKL